MKNTNKRKSKFSEKAAMNKFQIIIVGLLAIALSYTLYPIPSSYAAFEDLGVGARPLGMGNAFCAVADDANAFLYNPAGLTQIPKLEVSAMYANLYPMLNDKSTIANNYFAVAYPSVVGTFGFSWLSLNVGSDPERSNAQYSENTYIISYARYVEFLSLGFSLKVHTKNYGKSYWTELNPTFSNGNSAAGVGIDIGALYKMPAEGLNFGLFFSDINSPDVSLKNSSPVPIAMKLGISYDMLPIWSFNDLVAACDVSFRDADVKVNSGIEGWLTDRTIGLRFGLGFGTNNYGVLSLGASYKLTEEVYGNDFIIDYAFVYPLSGMEPTGGTHRFSLTMAFGGIQ